jgi:hypothetical protein
MMEMTITYKEATRDETIASWMEEETREVAEICADTQEAFFINTAIRNWRYEGNGTWAGKAHKDIVSDIMAIMVDAADYVVEHLDEIRAEAAAA